MKPIAYKDLCDFTENELMPGKEYILDKTWRKGRERAGDDVEQLFGIGTMK